MNSTNNSSISIIVSSKNRAEQLREMLKSVSMLSYSGKWELVVVDNNSSDHTQIVLDDSSRKAEFEFIFSKTVIGGVSEGRNHGVSLSSGDILAFFDDDCYPEKNFLEKINSTFKDSHVHYCGGKVMLHDPSDLPITIQNKPDKATIPPHTFIPSGLIHGANLACRRRAFMEINGFDTRIGPGTKFKSGEDTDLLRRFSHHGYTGVYNPEIVVRHHHKRKTQDDKKRLLNSYDYGVGAVYFKFLIHKETRRISLKEFYWHILKQRPGSILRQLKSGILFAVQCRLSSEKSWKHESSLDITTDESTS